MAGKSTHAEIRLPADPAAAIHHENAFVRVPAVDEVAQVQFAIEQLGP